ncbi:hypothetical protein V2J09_000573 [Rumex salicifolius]
MEISVSAMAGITGYSTMRVRDSGSTHNFIDRNIAAVHLGCRLTDISKTKVTVADGSSLDVNAKVDKLTWTFQDQAFETEAMVLPLACCDMVLGIQWLETLGPIVWDFSKLTMEFRVRQRRIVLTGIRPGFLREVKAMKLDRLISYDSDPIIKKNNLVVPDVAQLKYQILGLLHGSSVGGHSGRDATLHRARSFIPPISRDSVSYYIKYLIFYESL